MDKWTLIGLTGFTTFMFIMTCLFLYMREFKAASYVGTVVLLLVVSWIATYQEYVIEGTISFRCVDERVVRLDVLKQYETLVYVEHKTVMDCFQYKKYLRVEGDWKEVVE